MSPDPHRPPIRQELLICPPSDPLPRWLTEEIAALQWAQIMRLERALEVAAELDDELGPVTEAELEALREEWPPG